MINVNDLRWQKNYSSIVNRMKEFFLNKGWIEINGQSTLSILAACEDPETISQFIFDGINWPLPQTNQMNLETILLNNPNLKGVFCTTTSYRNEPNPIDGRHDKIFPMFEFESRGNIKDLIALEEELLEYMGFGTESYRVYYYDMCKRYNTHTLESEHEELIQNDYGDVVFLKDFPQESHPFWNMKHRGGGIYNKVDVLLYGMETIGSAERSTNVDEMRNQFYNISDGQYAKLLFNHFGKKRVEDELEDYLSLNMFERFGGGIGITRLVRAWELENKSEFTKTHEATNKY